MKINLKHLLAGVVALTACAAPAWELTSGGIYYSRIDGADHEMAVVPAREWGESLYSGDVVVPETVYFEGENYRVTMMADSAFWQSAVTAVQLPNSITRIGRAALAQCDQLTSVTLPLGLTRLSNNMLAGSAITALAVPEGVQVVGRDALRDCAQLHSLYLPASLKLIGEGALRDCFNLFEIFCGATTPPAVGGELFNSLSGIDLIVADDRATGAYSDDPWWGNTQTFSLWTSNDIWLPDNIECEAVDDNWQRIIVHDCLAYKLYGEDGNLLAYSAAPNFLLAYGDHPMTFTLVACNGLAESDDTRAIDMEPPVAVTAIDEVPVASEHPSITVLDGVIHISGDNHGTWTTVYDCYGQLYYQRPSVDGVISTLPTGKVYIVIVGDYVQKVRL